VTGVAFAPDGHRLFTGSEDCTVKGWAVEAAGEAIPLARETSGVWLAAFSGDSQQLVTVSGDNTAKVWDLRTRRRMLTLTGHTSTIYAVAFSRDGRRIVTGGADRTVRVWDTSRGRQLLCLGNMGRIHAVAFSPDGRRIVTGADRYAASVRDAATGRERLQLRGHRGPILAATFSPDGRQIATGDWFDIVRVWDAETGRERLALPGGVGSLRRKYEVAFSPDSRHLAVSEREGVVRVWDTAGRAVLPLGRKSGGVISGAFSPDGRRIVTTAAGDTARVWDTRTGREILALKDRAGILCAAFSPDGRRIVTGSADGKIQIWEAASPQQVAIWTAAEAAAEERRVAARRERDAATERFLQQLRSPITPGSGFISDWLILAPLPLEGGESGADGVKREQIPGEATLAPRPGDRVTVGGQELVWRPSYGQGDVIDFNDFLQQQCDNSLAYAVCYLTAAETMSGLQMKLGSDDQGRVYLNGREVFRGQEARELEKDQDTVTNLTLRRGTNVLVFKVANPEGDWRGCIRFVDRNGRPVTRIAVKLTP
jgi:dipeptidyl aminopeptidase/acylaminoacyl peptidase